MKESRPQKTYRINFYKNDPEFAANFSVFANPAEARVSASESSFISVKAGDEKNITLSPGAGGVINLQLLPQNLRYGGMISDLGFPMSLIPSTMTTPFPKQQITPPLINQISTIKEIAQIATMFVGL